MSVLLDFLTRVQPEHHDIIEQLDALIRKAAPDLVVSLKWRNPTYHSKRNACVSLPFLAVSALSLRTLQ